MGTLLHWKKGVFRSTYEIFSGELSVGKLNMDAWRNTGIGELNKKTFRFETKGFLNQETLIIDLRNNCHAGKITYNTWNTRAVIEYEGKTFVWKNDNVWNTKWSITNSEEIFIKYYGSFTNGDIEVFTSDDLLLLSGLYISHYFWQVASAVIAT